MFIVTCFGQLSPSSGICTVYIKEKVYVAYSIVKYFKYILCPDVLRTFQSPSIFIHVSRVRDRVSDTIGKIVTYYSALRRSAMAPRDFVLVPCSF